MDNNASTSGDPDWRTHESRRLPSKLVECFAVSPDGTHLIYGTPGQITISNLQTQSHTHTVLMEKGRVDSMAFSADGKGVVVGARLASTSSWKSREGHGVMVLDVDEVSFRMKSKMVSKYGRSQPPVRFVTFATQSQQIISVAGSAITLWDACSGKSIRSFNETTFLQRTYL
ncbi:hypothetical protein FRC02_005221 [Tulasnella sp. 418]|nr:hypothetical protein FRC02_005221 [Tulasnella sp. 418]